MTTSTAPHDCHQHLWERHLEHLGGTECVVRCCRRCGRKEICWSRRSGPRRWPRPTADVPQGEFRRRADWN
jgi:hypothetical protein